jgi:hypothetical protein
VADPAPVLAGPRWLPQVTVLASGTFAVGTDAFVIAGLLPDISRSLSVSVAAAGQLVSVFSTAYAVLYLAVSLSGKRGAAHPAPRGTPSGAEGLVHGCAG